MIKRKRGTSPIISGVKRAGNIIVDSSEFSSGIRAFEPNNNDEETKIIEKEE